MRAGDRGSWVPLARAAAAAAAFLLLGVLVATHVTQPVDVAARGFFRPHDAWGATQRRADVVVEGLKPRHVAVLLAGLAAAASLLRRSWRPGLYVAVTGALAGAGTLASKLALQRTDPHHLMSSDAGGSFPSGHTASVMVCAGLVVLLLHERSRWWEWALVALAGGGMGYALLVQAAHWLTDVVGGLLLAVAVLAAMSAAPLRDQRSGRRRGGRRPRRG